MKIKIEDIILEAFLDFLQDSHTKYIKEVTSTKVKVSNPFFFEQGKFVSFNYIDKYNNIVYTETQPGTNPEDRYHKIKISVGYDEYKPFHDKLVKIQNREKNITELLGIDK